MKRFYLVLLAFISYSANSQLLPGFKPSANFQEQQLIMEGKPEGTRILVNAPLNGFKKNKKVHIVFYALPNGNTIEQTFGKKTKPDNDWHFDIQHIGAQTRFLRKTIQNRTLVVAYLENSLKSWPAWKACTPGYAHATAEMVESVLEIFSAWKTEITLNGHSGGGRFVFNYLDAFSEIPEKVVRMAFIDSNYGYEDSLYRQKITRWLKKDRQHSLCVLAYNDSVVVYNGKPLVSPTGGTWWRSRLMLQNFAGDFRFKHAENDSLLWNTASRKRIEIVLKPNPQGKIYHTVQVERNGFIHSLLSGTSKEQKNYRYFGERAYSEFISDSLDVPVRRMEIPCRSALDETGSAFMKRIEYLPREQREEEIFKAFQQGNIPGFLRNTVTLNGEFTDNMGINHRVVYETMPDYLAVGSDEDFCRVPMTPFTAQKIADLYGASLITAKISDDIFEKAAKKPEPFFYKPVGNANETIAKFMEHNRKIEEQLKNLHVKKGELVSGIKKDVILSERISVQPDKVVIYGWHKPDHHPIQPVYSGHIWWYVDYSHGIRLISNQVKIDGKTALLSNILQDPILFRLFSNEDKPMEKSRYTGK